MSAQCGLLKGIEELPKFESPEIQNFVANSVDRKLAACP